MKAALFLVGVLLGSAQSIALLDYEFEVAETKFLPDLLKLMENLQISGNFTVHDNVYHNIRVNLGNISKSALGINRFGTDTLILQAFDVESTIYFDLTSNLPYLMEKGSGYFEVRFVKVVIIIDFSELFDKAIPVPKVKVSTTDIYYDYTDIGIYTKMTKANADFWFFSVSRFRAVISQNMQYLLFKGLRDNGTQVATKLGLSQLSYYRDFRSSIKLPNIYYLH